MFDRVGDAVVVLFSNTLSSPKHIPSPTSGRFLETEFLKPTLSIMREWQQAHPLTQLPLLP